jgi:alpha-glucosidase
MQWTAVPNAGFTRPGVQTWLPIPPNAASLNVSAELQNPQSMLIWYKRLIALKHRDAALHSGSETMLDRTNPHVLSWLRQAGNERVVVACNFTAEPQRVSLDLRTRERGDILLASPGVLPPQSLRDFALPAFGVVIARLR